MSLPVFTLTKYITNIKRVEILETDIGCVSRIKTLKGEPQERIWSETRSAGLRWVKAPRDLENLKVLGISA